MTVSLTIGNDYVHPRASKYFSQSGDLERKAQNMYRGMVETSGATHYFYSGPPIPEADKMIARSKKLSGRAFFVMRVSDKIGNNNEGLVSLVDSLVGWMVRQ